MTGSGAMGGADAMAAGDSAADSPAPGAVVMTGATRGIGLAAARELLRGDPALRLIVLARPGGSRPPDFGDGADRVELVDVDLASIASVRRAAAETRERLGGDPIAALLLTAGLQCSSALEATPDGLERTFAVNVVAPHLLLEALAPLVAPAGRSIVTVSDTHFGDLRHNLGMVPGPRWRDPAELARPGAFERPESVAAGRTAYSTSKLAAIHLVHERARRHPEQAPVVSWNPGFVPGTGLAREAGPFARFVVARILPALAATALATLPGEAGRMLADAARGRPRARSGAYLDRDREAASSAESHDPAREARLWEVLGRIADLGATPER